jgi:hypothetical protein
VRAAILEHYPALADSFEGADFTVSLVEFDASQLNTWYEQVRGLLLPLKYQLYWQGSDLDEAHNQIVVWYTNEEARAMAQEMFREEVDAPPGVIVAVLAEPLHDD